MPSPDLPWLSVLMPVHEGERWLDRTLASVDGADGIELLILDSSREPICQATAARHGARLSIRYEHCPGIASWTAKTNIAAHRARAPHLAMLHQDDLWLPGRAASLRTMIAGDAGAVMWLAPAQIVDQNGKALGRWRCPLPAGPVDAALLLERLMVQNFVPLPAAVFRRDAWAAVGGLDETLWYTPDWDLYLKLAQHGRVVYRPEATTAFRIHATSLTVTGSRDQADFARQMTRVIDRHIGAVAPQRRDAVLATARASVTVNCSLAAAASTGGWRDLVRAATAVLALAPFRLRRYWRDSRIADRLWPRLRARLAGAF